MNKEEKESIELSVSIQRTWLVGAYNHIESVKKVVKKRDIHVKLALNFAQSNIASALKIADMIDKKAKGKL